MDEHAADLGEFLTRDEKGKLLPGYLNGIAQALAQEQQQMIQELAQLINSVDHIKSVVSTQQSYAVGSSMIEPVQIRDLAEEALRLHGDSFARHHVTVVREFEPVPLVLVDRGRVLQILVNLISNAKNAMEDLQDAPRRLTLRVDVAAGSRLRIAVKDDGDGISAQNLTRIFAHGFTTRKSGHGFGLHSCALAASQMGGTLTAHSEGPGRGATFTLEFPIASGN
jgi:signal transduction histidine kinase